MPWGSHSVMDQKVRFVGDCLSGEASMAMLCRRYGISRTTGYVWLARYQAEGSSGLDERSRAPLCHGRAMPRPLADRLLAARRRKPHWGPRKLLAILAEEDPRALWPSPSAVSDLFRREGLSEPRRRRRRRIDMSSRSARSNGRATAGAWTSRVGSGPATGPAVIRSR